MSLKGKPVIIVGAGIGGLAAACALAQRGARVEVLEQASAITKIGAGIQISPNGFAVLDALGLGAEIIEVGTRAAFVRLRDYRRRGDVLALNMGQGGRKYYYLHRADLISVLESAARAAGARFHLDQSAEHYTQGTRPVVETQKGDRFEADLIVGADGLHSKMRFVLNGTLAPFFTQQTAWRAIVPNSWERGPDVHLHMGPRRHVVSYPLRGGEMMNIVAIKERSAWAEESWSRADDPEVLRAAFADFGDEVQELLAEVTEVHLWGLFRHPVAPHWSGDGLALLGDALHPTLPFLAQGASMALEDAWVLADALAHSPERTTALAAYQSRREARVRRVVDAASKNAWKYHLASPPLRWMAHQALRFGGRVAPGQMLGQFDWLYAHNVTRDGSY